MQPGTLRARHKTGTLGNVPVPFESVPFESFGTALRRLRERSRLTQEQLAERAGLSARGIRALERGERQHPYPHTLDALSGALEMSAEELAELSLNVPQRAQRRTAGGRDDDREPVTDRHPQGVSNSAPRRLPLPARRPTLGRDAEVAEVVANLVAEPPRPTVILGAPGIGKTNLALAALHDAAVAERYGGRRQFVRCEGATSASAAVIELARALGLPLVGADPLASCLTELATAPGVVCLDNAETPWEADTLHCEALFEHLANVAVLLVSLRGAERPGGAAWARPLRLAPLDAGSAMALFLAAAGDRFDQPGLERLLQEMGGVPLAVELLAHAAEGEVGLDGLAERWRSERVGLLERGAGDHRLVSVAVSVEVSWSGPLMTEPARRVLSLLGRLPDGIARTDLDMLLPNEGRRAASVLQRRGLAFDEAGRLRTHPPLRHHLAAAHPPGGADWARTIAHYCGLTSQLGWRVGTAGGARAAGQLTAETANLTAALLAGLGEDDPALALDALVGATRFVYFTGVDLGALFVSGLERVRALPPDRGVAGFVKGLGDVALARSDHVGARACYEEALPLYRTLGDVLGEANSFHGMGDIALRRSDHEGARASYEEALPLYRRVGDVLGEANCIQRLGDIALERSDHVVARARYEEALPLYRQVGDVLGEANCIHSLGDIALRRSDQEGARTRFQAALPLYRQVGDVLGEANCIQSLGDVALRRSDHERARACYEEALPLYRQVGDALGEANCIQGLGDIALERSHYERARARYEEALPLYRQVGSMLGEANCIQSLGDIALRQSDHEGAGARYEEALPLYRHAGAMLGEANCIQDLGDIALDRSDHERARAHYEEALPLYRRVGDVLGEANCIQRLGDIALLGPDHARAGAYHEEASRLYERIDEPYSLGIAHRRLARITSREHLCQLHVNVARRGVDQHRSRC
jgi:tetratricopeptide (TPR) repeat protein/transcriptional regulator with XRE-family HTH domain